MAGGYWYFYDHPMDGPPEVVSDIEYADPSVEQVAAPPPGAEYAPPPPGPPPPPPGEGAVGGAGGGAVVGGILGGLLTGRPGGAAAGAIVGGTTGAVIGAQAEQFRLRRCECLRRPRAGQELLDRIGDLSGVVSDERYVVRSREFHIARIGDECGEFPAPFDIDGHIVGAVGDNRRDMNTGPRRGFHEWTGLSRP